MLREIPDAYQDHLSKSRDRTLDQDTKLRQRGFWVGAFASLFLAIGAPYGNTVIRGSYMAADFNTPGAIFLFLVLIGLFNTIWKLTARHAVSAVGFATVLSGVWLWMYWPLFEIDIHSPGFIYTTPSVVSSLLLASQRSARSPRPVSGSQPRRADPGLRHAADRCRPDYVRPGRAATRNY